MCVSRSDKCCALQVSFENMTGSECDEGLREHVFVCKPHQRGAIPLGGVKNTTTTTTTINRS